MNRDVFSWPLFAAAPIVGIIRNLSPMNVAALLPFYQAAGLTTIEITLNTPGAEAIIQDALSHYAEGLNIGAGTVCTLDDLDKALAAGAQFIVTPILDEAVIRACVARNVPIFPGAFTPSEIYKAWSLGASMVKVFPATSLGPGFMKDLKAPLPHIKLLPTGGVTLANLTDFLKAGVEGVGIGSHLFDQNLIKAKDWAGLEAHFRAFVQQVALISSIS